MNDWKLVGIASDGESILLNGLNPWYYKWVDLREPSIIVQHPYYPSQEHIMDVYQIDNGRMAVKFGASEFSNLRWGFYLPVHKENHHETEKSSVACYSDPSVK